MNKLVCKCTISEIFFSIGPNEPLLNQLFNCSQYPRLSVKTAESQPTDDEYRNCKTYLYLNLSTKGYRQCFCKRLYAFASIENNFIISKFLFYIHCDGQFYVNLTRARVISEEEISREKMSLPELPMVHFPHW